MRQLSVGQKVKVNHGTGVIIGFERFNEKGFSAPMAAVQSEARDERIVVALDSGHTWCFDTPYCAFPRDIELNNPTVTHGTSHFIDRVAAFNYYSAQGYNYTRDDISRKIAAGEISTGEPPLQKGDVLSVIAGEGRYQITRGA